MTTRPWPKTVDGWALLAFGVFTVFALLGYGSFGLHPELLATFPGAKETYDTAYRLFSRGQIWVAFGVLLIPLVRHAGLKWLGAFAAVFALSLGSELLGTNYGIPFGGYSYTNLLGYKLFDDVPFLIPISWFFMAVPAWALGRLFAPDHSHRLAPIALGAFFLTAWDLALDPAMSFLTPFWRWEDTGPYYGMPWVNLFGWYLTGVALMGAFAALRVDRWLGALNPRWLVGYYALNVAMPLGMCLLAGLWWAALATVVALGLSALALRATQRSAALNPSIAS